MYTFPCTRRALIYSRMHGFCHSASMLLLSLGADVCQACRFFPILWYIGAFMPLCARRINPR